MRARSCGVTVGFLSLVLFAGPLTAQSQQSIRTQVFGETDEVKRQADDLNAKLLAPESYEAAMELYVDASDAMERGRDLERVREDLAEAKGYFERSIEAAKLAQTTFAAVLTARDAAERAESSRYAARDWNRAEEAFVAAAATLEGGNLNRAMRAATDVETRYRETEGKALAAKTRSSR